MVLNGERSILLDIRDLDYLHRRREPKILAGLGTPLYPSDFLGHKAGWPAQYLPIFTKTATPSFHLSNSWFLFACRFYDGFQ